MRSTHGLTKPSEDNFSDAGSGAGDITHGTPPTDKASKNQLNGTLRDEVEKGSSRAQSEGSEGSETSDDDEGEDLYVVEGIQGHRTRKGIVEYLIKWVGYDEAENTWEPQENLLPHARKVLQDYHDTIGGAPSANTVKRTKSKQALKSEASQDQPQRKKQKRSSASNEQDWTPSGKDWEPQVDKIDTVERNASGTLMAYILFKNGKKSKVTMDKVYQHCPRPMLRFYEAHLKFKQVPNLHLLHVLKLTSTAS
ncbi:hypothetical protein PV08_06482 [Exophiala spinifera]|uniref:Chromo domain-containing protein n=1 Tax=Exophiala spinifera TaxID=91928 RepID=A0A0D2BCT9_9EURO|nr:uncharacterized protein PV08_06482 [Exophiala spinifera]KIW16430.1 hypothetical protein PV08_06482 [Exophiala spinifera]